MHEAAARQGQVQDEEGVSLLHPRTRAFPLPTGALLSRAEEPASPLPPQGPGSPSSHLKSGKATSCRGICRRKSGFWHRGLPVTIFLRRSQSPSQASWQLQLKGLARRFLEEAAT